MLGTPTKGAERRFDLYDMFSVLVAFRVVPGQSFKPFLFFDSYIISYFSIISITLLIIFTSCMLWATHFNFPRQGPPWLILPEVTRLSPRDKPCMSVALLHGTTANGSLNSYPLVTGPFVGGLGKVQTSPAPQLLGGRACLCLTKL